MTLRGYFIASIVQWFGLAIIKIWLFNSQVFSSPGVQELFFWLMCSLFLVAVVRRLGVINYFEALFIIVTWQIANALFDLMFVSAYTGLGIFTTHMYWGGAFISILAIMLFHKKFHVQLRRELHAKHHGHGHHH